ncbi:unnamed protein product [Absidia cylindrospora]
MNLSDLVHCSTNGHHDHPMDSFYVPTTMHQQKAQDPSSSSSSSNTVVEAAAAAAAATGHPFLDDLRFIHLLKTLKDYQIQNNTFHQLIHLSYSTDYTSTLQLLHYTLPQHNKMQLPQLQQVPLNQSANHRLL